MSSHPSTIHLVRIHGWRLVRASLCDPSNYVPTLLPPFIVCSRGPRGIAGPRGYGPFYVYYTYKYFGFPLGGPRAGRTYWCRWGGASCPPCFTISRCWCPLGSWTCCRRSSSRGEAPYSSFPCAVRGQASDFTYVFAGTFLAPVIVEVVLVPCPDGGELAPTRGDSGRDARPRCPRPGGGEDRWGHYFVIKFFGLGIRTCEVWGPRAQGVRERLGEEAQDEQGFEG